MWAGSGGDWEPAGMLLICLLDRSRQIFVLSDHVTSNLMGFKLLHDKKTERDEIDDLCIFNEVSRRRPLT